VADKKCLYSVARKKVEILSAEKTVTLSSLDLLKMGFGPGDLMWLTLPMWFTSVLIF